MIKNVKKLISLVLVLAFALTMIAGCGSGSSSEVSASASTVAASDSSAADTSAAPSTETAKKEPVELTVWSHLVQNTEVPELKKVAEEWAAKTGNKVKVLFDATSFQAYIQAANSSKGPDIMYGVANDNLGTFHTPKLLAEVPQGIVTTDKYSQGAIDAVTIDGKQYAVPVAVESIALFYNTDKVATPPATWDELITKAKEVGFMMDISNLYMAWPLLSGKGAYTYKFNNGVYDVNDLGLGEPAKNGYALINSLVNEHKFMKADVNGTIANGNFKNGKTGFFVGGPWDVADLKKQTSLKFAVTTLPAMDGNTMKTFMGVQTAYVSEKSKNKEAAWELVQYLNENAAIPLYKAGNRIPALLSAQENQEFKADTYMTAFAAQAKVGEPLPNIAEMQDTWQPYQDYMKLVLTKKLSVDEMAKKVDEKIRNLNKQRASK